MPRIPTSQLASFCYPFCAFLQAGKNTMVLLRIDSLPPDNANNSGPVPYRSPISRMDGTDKVDACGDSNDTSYPPPACRHCRLAFLLLFATTQQTRKNGFRDLGWLDGSATAKNLRPRCMWLGRPHAAMGGEQSTVWIYKTYYWLVHHSRGFPTAITHPGLP